MDIQDVECCGMDWIDLVQDRDRWGEFSSNESTDSIK